MLGSASIQIAQSLQRALNGLLGFIPNLLEQITYIALLGSVALGAALAFGLGGRDVAAQLLSQAYDSGRQNKEQVKQDMRTGRDRGQQQAERAKDNAERKLDDQGAQIRQPRVSTKET